VNALIGAPTGALAGLLDEDVGYLNSHHASALPYPAYQPKGVLLGLNLVSRDILFAG